MTLASLAVSIPINLPKIGQFSNRVNTALGVAGAIGAVAVVGTVAGLGIAAANHQNYDNIQEGPTIDPAGLA